MSSKPRNMLLEFRIEVLIAVVVVVSISMQDTKTSYSR